MICPSCADRGVFRIAYHDGSEPDFAICRCPAGTIFRLEENQGKAHLPHYHVWALRHGIDPAHVAPMEDLLSAAEMAERGVTPAASATDAIAAAARARSPKR